MGIAKIYITGQIGSSYDNDGNVIEKGVELADVVMQVQKNIDAEILHFVLNTPGGGVEVGQAIADYVKALPNAWTIAGDMCASMGTEIHLCVPLERRLKIAGGKYIIHNPLLQGVTGNAAQLHEAAEYVDKYESDMLAMYHKATGLDKEALKGLMSLETSLTDEQCTSFKFVSAVIPAEIKPVAFSSKNQIRNINNQFNKIEMAKEIEDIVKSVFAKFAEGLGLKPKVAAVKVVAKKPNLKAEVLTTDKDVTVYTDTPLADFIADPTKQVKLFSDEAMTMPMADGTYTLKDGSTIMVASGLLSEYTPMEADADVNALIAENAQLKAELATKEKDMRAEFEAELETQLNTLKAELGSTYTPKAAIANPGGQRTIIAKKVDAGNENLSMKEKAAAERATFNSKGK